MKISARHKTTAEHLSRKKSHPDDEDNDITPVKIFKYLLSEGDRGLIVENLGMNVVVAYDINRIQNEVMILKERRAELKSTPDLSIFSDFITLAANDELKSPALTKRSNTCLYTAHYHGMLSV